MRLRKTEEEHYRGNKKIYLDMEAEFMYEKKSEIKRHNIIEKVSRNGKGSLYRNKE